MIFISVIRPVFVCLGIVLALGKFAALNGVLVGLAVLYGLQTVIFIQQLKIIANVQLQPISTRNNNLKTINNGI